MTNFCPTFWSPFTSQYLLFIGAVGASSTALLTIPGSVDVGIKAKYWELNALRRLAGIILPGNGSRVNPPPPSGRVVRADRRIRGKWQLGKIAGRHFCSRQGRQRRRDSSSERIPVEQHKEKTLVPAIIEFRNVNRAAESKAPFILLFSASRCRKVASRIQHVVAEEFPTRLRATDWYRFLYEN